MKRILIEGLEINYVQRKVFIKEGKLYSCAFTEK